MIKACVRTGLIDANTACDTVILRILPAAIIPNISPTNLLRFGSDDDRLLAFPVEFQQVIERLVQGEAVGFYSQDGVITILFIPDSNRKTNGNMSFVEGVLSSSGGFIIDRS
jgi:hypothetical protein